MAKTVKMTTPQGGEANVQQDAVDVWIAAGWTVTEPKAKTSKEPSKKTSQKS